MVLQKLICVRSLAVMAHMFMILPARCIITPILLYILIFHSYLRILVIMYLFYILYDIDTPSRGGNRWQWFRSSRYFEYFAEYFPIKQVLTSELPKDRNYLGVQHPHGALFLANSATLAGDGCNFEGKTGLNVFSTTLNFNFIWPIVREYFLATGFTSANEKSLKYLLEDPKGGNFVVLMPGGAKEAGFAEPGKYRILLRSRKGFCRVAIQTGCDLVPIFIFGEVDCFDLLGEWHGLLRWGQDFLLKWTGVNLFPFGNKKNTIPYIANARRTPITIVVGSPIPVAKKSTPTAENITKLHEQYITCLIKLFDEHKAKYTGNPRCELIIE